MKTEIFSSKKSCECKIEIPFIEWENHILKCKKYQEEIHKFIKNIVIKDAKK